MRLFENPPFYPKNFSAPRSRPYPGPTQYALDLQERLLTASGGRLRSTAEWPALTQEERQPFLGPMRSRAMIYSLRIDLAVEPFAAGSLAEEFDRMLTEHQGLVQRLLEAHWENTRDLPYTFSPPSFESLHTANPNPRCFMAVEIERGNPSMKYLLGSVMNAAAWGKLGVIVCWDHPKHRSVMGIRETLALLQEYGKNTIQTGNLLVLSREQMNAALNIPTDH